MKLMKNILGRVFALWAILAFVLTLLLFLLPIVITRRWNEPECSRRLQKVLAAWMKVFFVLVGIRRIFKGKEHFRHGHNYIVVCNHNSFMDVPLASAGIPGPTKTIAKIEMARIPVFGIVYKSGSVLVDRKSERSRSESYNKMKEVLQLGMHMCIYPEGTRNKTAEPLQRFHDGAFRLSVDTRKEILPAVIFYTARVLPQHKTFYFWPHRVEMHFLPPVSSENKTAQALKEEIFGLMHQYYVRHNR